MTDKSRSAPRAVPRAKVAALLAVPLALGAAACQRDRASADADAVPGARAMTATIRVETGNGRLAGGEVYEIAQWRSGARGDDGLSYADFRGQDGGPTLDLRLAGLSGPGAFDCASGNPGAVALELRVDAGTTYRAAEGATCRVELVSADDGTLEGRYRATLRRKTDARDQLTVTGTFRANPPSATDPVADIKAARGPKLGLR